MSTDSAFRVVNKCSLRDGVADIRAGGIHELLRRELLVGVVDGIVDEEFLCLRVEADFLAAEDRPACKEKPAFEPIIPSQFLELR